jgi:hypothetical protein
LSIHYQYIAAYLLIIWGNSMQYQSHFRISQGILALAFAALFILALAACGSDTSQQDTTTVPNLAAPTQPPVTEQPTLVPTEQPTQAPPTATPTTAPFNWRTLKPTYASNATPYYGGRLSDFLGYFGQPTTSGGNTLTWNAALAWMDGSTSSNTLVSVDFDGNKVREVKALDLDQNSTWNMDDSKSACIPFEAVGGKVYNDTGATGGTEYLDFHSDIGDFVMMVNPGACSIYAPSS